MPLAGGIPINEIHGHITGLKPSELKSLAHLYRRRITPESFAQPEVIRTLSELSRSLNRQLGLLVDRMGTITHVIVGDAHKIFLPDFGRVRSGQARFRGLRLWLTHLNGEPLNRDNLTDLALLRLDLLVMVQVLGSGLPGAVEYAHLVPPGPSKESYRVEKAHSTYDLKDNFLTFIRELESEFNRTVDGTMASDGRERAMLVGVASKDRKDAEESLQELARLADTAQLHVIDQVLQKRPELDPSFIVGKGKLEDIVIRAMQLGADVLVFDHDLKPSQLRGISDKTDLKVLDRTQLILDIFAQHAESRAGKLQVEVAQLRYVMPRLGLMNTAMSRLTGGIGGRGPGETKLEINKRRANERLTRLERELKALSREREERRKSRRRSAIPVVSLVGYTNAGKSTLLNALTRSEVRAEDRLFATLDPVSRRMRFPEDREIILTDTVGFIKDLPHDLFEAFKATLEEVEQSDLLIHVIDASQKEPGPHLDAVEKVLTALEVSDVPRLLVWNKIDCAEPEQVSQLIREYGGLAISAARGEGLEPLLLTLEQLLWKPGRELNPVGRARDRWLEAGSVLEEDAEVEEDSEGEEEEAPVKASPTEATAYAKWSPLDL